MISHVHMIKLAFRNVFRNKRRSILTMIVIMLSVGSFLFMMSYMYGVMNSVIEDSIKATGHLNIQHPEYALKERMMSLTVPVEDYSGIINTVETIPGIKSVTGRIKFGAFLDFGEDNEPGLGMGIDSERERDILNLENSIVDGAYFAGGDKETVIGAEFAKKLNITIGDTITVVARTAYSSLSAENLIVVGIADLLNSMLNRIFYLPLHTAQQLLDMQDQVVEIVVFLEDSGDLVPVQNQIKALPEIAGIYSTISWSERGLLKDFLPLIKVFIGIVIFIFGIIASFSIINTMLMAVFERTHEIGIMTAFGMKRRNILILFLLEAVIIGAFGGLVGMAAGGYGGYWIETYGIQVGKIADDMPFPMRQTLYGDVEWWQAITAFSLGLVLSLSAAILPALKAARLKPADALRKQ